MRQETETFVQQIVLLCDLISLLGMTAALSLALLWI